MSPRRGFEARPVSLASAGRCDPGRDDGEGCKGGYGIIQAQAKRDKRKKKKSIRESCYLRRWIQRALGSSLKFQLTLVTTPRPLFRLPLSPIESAIFFQIYFELQETKFRRTTWNKQRVIKSPRAPYRIFRLDFHLIRLTTRLEDREM